jgi:predicted phage baseplate assembly protein
MSGKTTRLELLPLHDSRTAMSIMPGINLRSDINISFLRSLLYHLQSEPVTLADEVMEAPVEGPDVELQRRVDHLRPGQWVIVAGERIDVRDANDKPVAGIRAAELGMIGLVKQIPAQEAPGDTLHTWIAFVKPLAYSYKRSTAVVYGNVIKASHGEVVNEALGSGDAARDGQRFSFKRGPLTFTTAATPSGVESSEVVRVNGLKYERVESLLDAGESARAYTLEVDAAGLATVTFGGARLPSGSQNVRTEYRVGIGSAGNARAEQISLLTTRPLGVTGVLNPLRASGGADPDTAAHIRRNIPSVTRGLSTVARLVSIEDYANFARRFAGIGQADAVQISDGSQQLVYVTVAGVDDVRLDSEGELLQNLRAAYADYGDPAYPVEIGVRDLKILIMQARIRVTADASWELVQPLVRARLAAAFGFDRRRLGQSAYLSEAITAIHTTPGVASVDMDTFGAVAESQIQSTAALAQAMRDLTLSPSVAAKRARLNREWTAAAGAERFMPSQLVRVLPDAPALLAINLA